MYKRLTKTQFNKLKRHFSKISSFTDKFEDFKQNVVIKYKDSFLTFMEQDLKLDMIYLEYIYTDEKSRGKGYGFILYNNLIKVAKENEVSRITLNIRYNNPESLALALKCGARITGYCAYPNGMPGYELEITVNQ